MTPSYEHEFSVVRRATLLIPSNPAGDLSLKHLFVVMCDPAGAREDVLLVPASTYKEGSRGHDPTCLLEQGEHPFIKHTSYIQYRSARQEQAGQLKRGVERKLYAAQAPMDEVVFQRILAGFYTSDFVKPFALAYLPGPSPFA